MKALDHEMGIENPPEVWKTWRTRLETNFEDNLKTRVETTT